MAQTAEHHPPLCRCGNTQQAVPAERDAPAGQRAGDDGLKDRRHFRVAEGIQLALREPGETRTDVEAEELCQRHGEMGDAVGIDGQPVDLRRVLPQGALDRRAGLALVQHDRLVMDQRPVIGDVGIAAHRGRAAARIGTG